MYVEWWWSISTPINHFASLIVIENQKKKKLMELGRFWWWVVLVFFQFGINGCFGCWEQERTALLQIKASMINYTYANSFTSWDSANKESDSFNFIYIYIVF